MNLRRLPGLLLALCALACALPSAAFAAVQWTMDGKVTVRNGSGDFVLGYATGNESGPNTPKSDHFNEQASDGGWIYGWVEGPGMGRWGGLPQCGWVLPSSKSMHRNGRTAEDRCPPPNTDYYSATNPLAPRTLFDAGSWFQGTRGGTVYPAVIVACANPFAYLNYDPAAKQFRNRYDKSPLPAGRGTRTEGGRGAATGYSGFGIRYYAGDAALIKDSQAAGDLPTWFFVRKECIQPLGGALFTPQLRIGSTKFRGRTVTFSGRGRGNLPQYVGTARQTLEASFSCGGKTVSRRVNFRIVGNGTDKVTAWSASLRAPSSCRRGKVAIAYGGDQAFGPQRVIKDVRRQG